AALREGYEGFDPRAYLQNNYLPPRADFSSEEFVVPWKLRCLAETFASGEGSHPHISVGTGLIPVGSCPHVPVDAGLLPAGSQPHMPMGSCPHVPAGAGLIPRESHPCGRPPPRREPWQEKERRLRDRLRRILPIDVHRPDPLGAPLRPPADALLSAFCLEAVSPDLDAFARALAHVGSLLRPGGHALLLGALGESFYLAGAARLPVVPLAEDDV
ncbi:PNMT methyltransferase, partial [Burhinus bistriatus]|nr:PNMT methyltransferase [Burhinus bistriatus]